ncbi:MAG TPA: hypothetical protein VJP84_12600 [Steroidobacteraceae bacterium]|nr:hypothetical protein [Steroidobacteraceae bacterium]
MRALLRAGLTALAFCVSTVSWAQDALPPELRNWQGWVLKGEEFRRCPFLASTTLEAGKPVDAGAFRCAWPERLGLDVDARGGEFTQRWQLYAESWVILPGSLEHWPQDVRVNGAPGAVVEHDGAPSLRLPPGNHAITGAFSWSARPESLPVPAFTALVDLSVDQQRVAQPERPDGAVWLGKRRTAEQAAAMEVQVYRLVRDEVPTYLLTRLRLNVAGEAREELLGRVLPEGFTPLSLTGDVPARIERDGHLRVQVRAGSHEIHLLARARGVENSLQRPDPQGSWPREEIWSFAATDGLRVAAAEGPEGIDPAQANVPPDWQAFPAFRMAADSKLTLVERSRGLSNADDNRLGLQRDLWLDFDHGGFTAVDNIHGNLRRDWRLDMAQPFELESATSAGEPLLVTLGADGRTGLELRQPQLQLTAVARTPARGSMPATGWNQRFDSVTGSLHLPPGHRLIAVLGADEAPNSWFERWGLWNVFGIALIVVFVYWMTGLVPAVIAALALLLTYQEIPEFIWLWGNLLAALAIARAAPGGRFRKWAHGYRTVSFVVLALALLPFMWMQVRYALYPQLEQSFYVGYDRGYAAAAAPEAAAAAVDAAAPPIEADIADMPAPPPSPRTKNLIAQRGLNSLQVMQRYASGTRLQAGPGIPAWNYNTYLYRWSGPVEVGDSVRFLYIGPVLLFFWRILGVAALGLLFLWLARLSYGGRWRLPGMPAQAPASIVMPLLVLAALIAGSSPALAQDVPVQPDSKLLGELKERLTAAPACAPDCAELAEARVHIEGDRLEIVLRVSALAQLAVAMPHASDRWQLDDVSVDARPSLAMGRENDSSLWVPLAAGAHTVRLAGRLAAAESIQVAFPQTPRVVTVNARGWTVSGVNEGRLVSGSLELARERGAQRLGSAEALETGAEFPAFVRVERLFNLDLDWTIENQVTRIAPLRAAVSVQIPLVKGESVLTPGVETRGGVALIGLAAGEASAQWSSGLVRGETLELTLTEGAPRTEVWSFLVSPQWHVEFEGFPPVMPESLNAGNWVFRFIPRPGEKLVAHVTRPKGAEGTTLAIDSVRHTVEVGKRSTNNSLQFQYRSTQGGRHVVKLPTSARVTSVRFDNQPVQLRPEKGELPLALSPGSHVVEVDWEQSEDAGFRTRPSAVDLGSPASNIFTQVNMPASRWPLFAHGAGVGPAFLYWGELVVFIAIAWLLGRWKQSPLRFVDWLLLGLGLSTQSWWVFSFTAAWLLVMRWREQWQPAEDVPRWRFNAVQVLLAAFTVTAIFTLLFSGIRNGLLSAPDMGVEGANSWNGQFQWFQDQTAGPLDLPVVYSVPMWVYRLLFFVWAGWMAFALVKWLRWAFNAWKTAGLWR